MGGIGTEQRLMSSSAGFSMAADDLKNMGVPEKKLACMNIEELLKGLAATAGDESQSFQSSSEQEEDPAATKKTVDEIWRAIHEGKESASQGNEQQENYVLDGPRRTLGEMTLEEFLVKSGVVRGEGDAGMGCLKREREDESLPEFMQSAMGIVQQQHYPHHAMLPDTKPYKRMRGAGSGHLVPYVDESVCVHNKPEDYVDKVAERRQRRMIKNRESAARSRARKQAYTAELEAEVTHLKEENEALKREQASHARWRKKVMDIFSVLERSRGEATRTGQRGETARTALRRTTSF